MQNILEMTHEELMKSSEETRMQYNKAKKLYLYELVKSFIESGYKTILIGRYGCIKVRKNSNGIFYSIRNGKGTGVDCSQHLELKDATDEASDFGWFNYGRTEINCN